MQGGPHTPCPLHSQELELEDQDVLSSGFSKVENFKLDHSIDHMEPPLIEPDSFDMVVLGSSLGCVAMAAALAKSKRRVLILEGQDCYGGESSSFTIHCMREAALKLAPSGLFSFSSWLCGQLRNLI